MSDLLKRLENLSPKKRELILQKLLAQQSSQTNNKYKVPPIEQVSRNKDFGSSTKWRETALLTIWRLR